MPKVIAKFKCQLCEDIFEAESDTYADCKCGKCSVKPSEYSTTYKIDNGRGKNFERLEEKIYRYEEEYTKLSDEFYELWNKLKAMKEERSQKYMPPSIYIYERKDKSDDGKSFMSSLSVEVFETNNYHESTSLNFKVDLSRHHNPNEVFRRLHKFYKLLLKIISNEIDLKNREQMKEVSDDWYKKQCDLYDYEFYV